MPSYIPDTHTKRWVVLAPDRQSRPHDETISEIPVPRVCPFCAGNEHLTPPEVYRIGEGTPDGPGWHVRVVPNKYPITDIHEVIIHSPSCEHDIESLPEEQVVRILTAYRDRYRFYSANGQVIIFCNHGLAAGASLKHPHSQLVVVPKQIALDALSIEPVTNIVAKQGAFVAYCPSFSQWPLETWIAPNKPGMTFGDMKDQDFPDVAILLQKTLQSMSSVMQSKEFPMKPIGEQFLYNYYIYHGVNWFIRIIPRTIHRAGFELGSGLSVNVVNPEDAAIMLRNR